MEPAISIIKKCGGYASVAKIVGLSEVQVRRWTYPKEKRGTGGNIPIEHANKLMKHKRKFGLTADEFFRRANT